MKTLLVFALIATAALAVPSHHHGRGNGHNHNVPSNSTIEKRGGSSCPGNSGTSKMTSAERADYLSKHNQFRRQEGVPDLTWDDSLAAQAQILANEQNTCQMQHKYTECGSTELGQNLAWDWQPQGHTTNMPASSAVQGWYDEKADYDFGSKKCRWGKVCTHYTQLAWRGTTHVGCALRKCGSNGEDRLAVCDYYPKGNWMGQSPLDYNNV